MYIVLNRMAAYFKLPSPTFTERDFYRTDGPVVEFYLQYERKKNIFTTLVLEVGFDFVCCFVLPATSKTKVFFT